MQQLRKDTSDSIPHSGTRRTSSLPPEFIPRAGNISRMDDQSSSIRKMSKFGDGRSLTTGNDTPRGSLYQFVFDVPDLPSIKRSKSVGGRFYENGEPSRRDVVYSPPIKRSKSSDGRFIKMVGESGSDEKVSSKDSFEEPSIEGSELAGKPGPDKKVSCEEIFEAPSIEGSESADESGAGKKVSSEDIFEAPSIEGSESADESGADEKATSEDIFDAPSIEGSELVDRPDPDEKASSEDIFDAPSRSFEGSELVDRPDPDEKVSSEDIFDAPSRSIEGSELVDKPDPDEKASSEDIFKAPSIEGSESAEDSDPDKKVSSDDIFEAPSIEGSILANKSDPDKKVSSEDIFEPPSIKGSESADESVPDEKVSSEDILKAPSIEGSESAGESDPDKKVSSEDILKAPSIEGSESADESDPDKKVSSEDIFDAASVERSESADRSRARSASREVSQERRKKLLARRDNSYCPATRRGNSNDRRRNIKGKRAKNHHRSREDIPLYTRQELLAARAVEEELKEAMGVSGGGAGDEREAPDPGEMIARPMSRKKMRKLMRHRRVSLPLQDKQIDDDCQSESQRYDHDTETVDQDQPAPVYDKDTNIDSRETAKVNPKRKESRLPLMKRIWKSTCCSLDQGQGSTVDPFVGCRKILRLKSKDKEASAIDKTPLNNDEVPSWKLVRKYRSIMSGMVDTLTKLDYNGLVKEYQTLLMNDEVKGQVDPLHVVYEEEHSMDAYEAHCKKFQADQEALMKRYARARAGVAEKLRLRSEISNMVISNQIYQGQIGDLRKKITGMITALNVHDNLKGNDREVVNDTNRNATAKGFRKTGPVKRYDGSDPLPEGIQEKKGPVKRFDGSEPLPDGIRETEEVAYPNLSVLLLDIGRKAREEKRARSEKRAEITERLKQAEVNGGVLQPREVERKQEFTKRKTVCNIISKETEHHTATRKQHHTEGTHQTVRVTRNTFSNVNSVISTFRNKKKDTEMVIQNTSCNMIKKGSKPLTAKRQQQRESISQTVIKQQPFLKEKESFRDESQSHSAHVQEFAMMRTLCKDATVYKYRSHPMHNAKKTRIPKPCATVIGAAGRFSDRFIASVKVPGRVVLRKDYWRERFVDNPWKLNVVCDLPKSYQRPRAKKESKIPITSSIMACKNKYRHNATVGHKRESNGELTNKPAVSGNTFPKSKHDTKNAPASKCVRVSTPNQKQETFHRGGGDTPASTLQKETGKRKPTTPRLTKINLFTMARSDNVRDQIGDNLHHEGEITPRCFSPFTPLPPITPRGDVKSGFKVHTPAKEKKTQQKNGVKKGNTYGEHVGSPRVNAKVPFDGVSPLPPIKTNRSATNKSTAHINPRGSVNSPLDAIKPLPPITDNRKTVVNDVTTGLIMSFCQNLIPSIKVKATKQQAFRASVGSPPQSCPGNAPTRIQSTTGNSDFETPKHFCKELHSLRHTPIMAKPNAEKPVMRESPADIKSNPMKGVQLRPTPRPPLPSAGLPTLSNSPYINVKIKPKRLPPIRRSPVYMYNCGQAAKRAVKPAAKRAAKPTVKRAAKPAVKPSVKPSVKPVVTPAVKPAVKPSVKPVVTLAVKPSAKPVVKPAVKPAIKPDLKPAVKPVSKPTIKPTVKPAVKKASNSKRKPKELAPLRQPPAAEPADSPTPAGRYTYTFDVAHDVVTVGFVSKVQTERTPEVSYGR